MSRDWDTVCREHLDTIELMRPLGPQLDQLAARLADCLRRGGRVWVLGNGGSAADAQHIAAEFLGRFKRQRRGLPVIALPADAATLTAIGNDLGFEHLFARQLEALLQPHDLVWALSTSGTSPNVIQAVELAQKRGVPIIGFTGRNGQDLAARCTWSLRVPHTDSDRIQEAHQLAYHYICERVEAALDQPA